MRSVAAALMLLIAGPAAAAECLKAQIGRAVVLRGIVEYRHEPRPPGAFSVFLKLASPICVVGSKYDGTKFKLEDMSSIAVGIPAHLNRPLRQGDDVTLRGELWGPAVNEKDVSVTFALTEVL